MLETLKNLGRNSAIYGLGSVLQRILQIVLLPIYTRVLAPEEYGVLAVMYATATILRPLLWLGMPQALIWAVVYRNRDERAHFSAATLYLVAQGAALAAVGVWWAADLSRLILHTPAYAALVRLVLLTTLVEVLENQLCARLRIHERAVQFSAMLAARLVVGAALGIVFLVVFRRGVAGLLEAGLITSALVAVYAVYAMRDALRPRIRWSELKPLLGFCLPLVPAQIAAMALVVSDRYILQAHRSEAEVGLYALGYSIALSVQLITHAVQLGWVPQMYQIAKRPDAPHQYRRILTYFAAGLAFAALALSLFGRELLLLLATPKYLGAERVVPLVSAAYVLAGVAGMANVGITTRNKNHYTTVIVAASALVNVALNFALIPRWGMMGAAWATFAAYLLQAVLQVWANQRLWAIPYEFGRLAFIAAFAAACYGASLLAPTASLAAAVTLKLALLLAFPAALALPWFLDNSERATLRRLVARWLPPR